MFRVVSGGGGADAQRYGVRTNNIGTRNQNTKI